MRDFRDFILGDFGIETQHEAQLEVPFTVEHETPPTAKLWANPPQATFVDMNEVQYECFTTGAHGRIGTYGLDGCTAIVIASPRGALVAHVSPMKASFMMRRIKEIYDELKGTELACAAAYIIAPGSLGRDSQTAEGRRAVEGLFRDQLHVMGFDQVWIVRYPRVNVENMGDDAASRQRVGRMGAIIVEEDGAIYLDQNIEPIICA